MPTNSPAAVPLLQLNSLLAAHHNLHCRKAAVSVIGSGCWVHPCYQQAWRSWPGKLCEPSTWCCMLLPPSDAKFWVSGAVQWPQALATWLETR